MRRRQAYLALTFVCITAGCKEKGSAAGDAAPPPTAASVAPDLKAIAHSVVTRTVGIKEGDIVTVSGSPRDLELLEDIAIEVEKAGGHALPIIGTERMTRLSYDEVPAKYDATSGWRKILSSNTTVQITIDQVETPDLLANVPAERIATRSKASLEANGIFYKRNTRSVDVGNGMYPTHARAAMFGMSRDELATFFWSALNADFAALQANAKHIQDAIGTAREIHITDANGTDLRLGMSKTKWRVSDGVMSDENIKNRDVQKYLPAGELYSLVDPGSAEGTIVMDHYPYEGKDITGFTVKISKGKVMSMTGSPELATLKKTYDADTHPGKSEITVLDFGLNPGIRASAAKALRTWVPEGMVTVVAGNDTWVGGTNNAPTALGLYLASATVTADGKVIIENGTIKR